MKRKILTAIISIALLWFSFPTESLAAEDGTMLTEIAESDNTEDSDESAEEPAEESTEDLEEGDNTNEVEMTDEIDETEETEKTEESVEADDAEETEANENPETETIIEQHTENHCTITISYTKEVYDDPFARLDTTELSLESTYELVENQSLDEFIQNIENEDIQLILSEISFDDEFTNGYNILASIDVDNNVSIESVQKTTSKEVVTEVEVEITKNTESKSDNEE